VGFHEEGFLALKYLLEKNYPVTAIFTLNEEASGKRAAVRDFSKLAEKYKVRLVEVSHINDESSVAELKELSPNILFVIGWSQILSKDVLSIASDYTIGAHASLLPKNRGSAPINWSLINGELVTGNTLIELSEEVDAGAVLSQRKFQITLYDSCHTLYQKVAVSNRDMIVDFLMKYHSSNVEKKEQKIAGLPVLPRRRPQDGLINWQQSAKKIYDFIRALTKPYPGAFSYLGGKKVYLWKASYSESSHINGLGRFSEFYYSFEPELCSVRVECMQGSILIHQIEVEGEGMYFGADLHDRLKGVLQFDE
jgi:methionyl-tRNA formyltransferase